MSVVSHKPILYYFEIPGRAEATRLAFTIGHIDFEDVRISFEAWRTKYKPLMPAGLLPVLELDHIKYCESKAILTYAAKRAGLIPEDPKSLLCMWQAIDGLEKVFRFASTIMNVKPEDIDQVKRVEGPKLDEALEAYAKLIERTQHPKGFVAGDKLSAADLSVYGAVRQLRHPFSGWSVSLGSNIPQIKKIMDLVESVPEVREYYKLQ